MNLDISQINNYNDELNIEVKEILNKYTILVKDYLDLFDKNVHFTNDNYLNNIFLKGLNAVNHIFNIILLYTKNLNLAFNYGQKSIFYFIEFIEQINEDSNSFLQLNSHDAVLFVYKKTIYEINNNHKKNFTLSLEHEIKKFNLIKEHTDFVQKLLSYYLDKKIKIKTIKIYINKITKRFSNKNLTKITLILDNLILKNIDINKLNLIILFLLKKEHFDEKVIVNKLNSDTFYKIQNGMSVNKFIAWLTGL